MVQVWQGKVIASVKYFVEVGEDKNSIEASLSLRVCIHRQYFVKERLEYS